MPHDQARGVREIAIAAQPLDRYAAIVGADAYGRYAALAERARRRFEGRVIWNVSSTAAGGGVAEMLRALLPYARGVGVDMRWLVVDGSPEFFRVTKRIHHALHGAPGDGSDLGAEARITYKRALGAEADALRALMRPGDVVLLHDPQTAGLIPGAAAAGGRVIWRCHIGHDRQNEETTRGWHFLEKYVREAHATVFSRAAFVPPCCERRKARIIHPSIDPFAPKNQELDAATVAAILGESGIASGRDGDGQPRFTREDGSPGRVSRRASVVDAAVPLDVPLVLQVSRWDTLKDHAGVIEGFAWMLESGRGANAHLAVVGPDPAAVADDPEGATAYEATLQVYRALDTAHRARIHVVTLPMDDPEENAAMVNALQRHAAVIVQKSLAEGFGLTVTEAMAKGRPVVASAVGGILEQIEDGVHGRLLRNPRDPEEFAARVAELLADPAAAAAMGQRARERVEREFSGLESLRRYAELMLEVDDKRSQSGLRHVGMAVSGSLRRLFAARSR